MARLNPQQLAGLWSGPIARGAVVSLTIRVAGMALLFLQGVFVARLVGPDGYGTVAVALSVVNIAATLSLLGLGQLAIRTVAQLTARADWDRLRGFRHFSIVAVLAASTLATSLVAATALGTDLIDAPLRSVITLAAPMITLQAMMLLLRGHCQGHGRVVAAQAPGEVLRPALTVLVLAALVVWGSRIGPSTVIVAALLAAGAAAAIGGMALHRIVATAAPPSPRSMDVRAWTAAAAPFLGLTIVAILQGELNTLMLAWLAGPTEAGLFQPVARLAPLMVIGFDAVAMRYAPRVSELWERGEMAGLVRTTRLVTATTTLAALVACGMILVASPWILSAFGQAFTVTAPALWWVAAAQLCNSACGPVGMLLSMTGHQSMALVGHVAGLAANAALGVLLIPGQGTYGAVQAMAGGIVVWNLLILLMVRRRLGFDPSLFGALFPSAGHRR